MADPGAFVISLDFELYWGVRDAVALEDYRRNLEGERAVVPLLLDLFAEHDVRATWAAVGFLLASGRDDLRARLPGRRPAYRDDGLSPYGAVDALGESEEADPLHFAPSLARLIHEAPGQELATHTFSHYYCLEPGQDADAFRADLAAAVAAAAELGAGTQSIVFPRNQVNPAYLPICAELGVRAYRGTERAWFHRARPWDERTRLVRALSLADAYLPLSGHNAYRRPAAGDVPADVPSSRFLRPYAPRLAALEPLKLRRIRRDLDHAARYGLVYHLWWHPHNFGAHTERNLAQLRSLLEHVATLRDRYGLESLAMRDLAA